MVGRRSSMVPHELIPILETVSKASSKLRKALAGQVVKGAQGLMHITEQVSKHGADALSQSTKLASCTAQMADALQGVTAAGSMSWSTCEVTPILSLPSCAWWGRWPTR